MSRSRSGRLAPAVLAAAVGGSLVLGGCGGGSLGGSASSPGGASSPAAAAPATAGATVKLTGHFCADFTNIGAKLPKIPAGESGNLNELHRSAAKILGTAAANFNALAGEAPPQVAGEIRTIASAYQALAGGVTGASSVTEVEQQMGALSTSGQAGRAFINLVRYLATKCG